MASPTTANTDPSSHTPDLDEGDRPACTGPCRFTSYERGLDVPSSASLIRLSRALGVGLDYLLRPGPAWELRFAPRKHTTARKRDLEAFLERARDVLERWLVAEELVLGRPVPFRPPEGFPREVRSVEEAERAAEDLRQLWDLGGGPIADLCGVVELHGVRVAEIEAPEGIDGMAMVAEDGEQYAIIAVRRGIPGDRQRFTVAHELAHLLLRASEDQEEAVCHRFAAAFLVPARALREDLGSCRRHLSRRELLLLKHRYGVSMQALVRRAGEAGILEGRTVEALLREFGRRGERRREPGPQVPPEPAGRRLEGLVLRGIGEGLISRRRAEELLGRPLSEHRAATAGR